MKNRKKIDLPCRGGNLHRLCVLALFLMFGIGAFAQGITVTGVVRDNTDEPVLGATVIVKGTQNAAVTDFDGNFTLKDVPSDATLDVSYIGFKTASVPVRGQEHLDITIYEDSEALDEIVVVGYGVQKKSDVTGALTHVSAKDLTSRPVSNAFEALQGKAAGVDITTSERPGTLGNIYIRGTRSLSASSDPLYVVDGVPLQNGDMSNINPRDIENINILKDASATAIYGSRGANGVILITTKRGNTGRLSLNYSGSVTFETLVDKAPMMDADDYITWRRWAFYNAGQIDTPGNQPNYASDQIVFADVMGDRTTYNNIMNGWVNETTWDASRVKNTDWTGMVTRTGVSHEHYVSASGGTEKFNAYASLGYLSNQGTQRGQDYSRYNATVAVDLHATDWFELGASMSASYSVQQYGYSRTGQSTSTGPTDIYSAARNVFAYALPTDEDGNITTHPGNQSTTYTVYQQWDCSNDQRKTTRIMGSFYANVNFGKIWKPLEGLSYRFNFGPEFSYYRQGIFIPSDSAVRMGSSSYASWDHQDKTAWTIDNQLLYTRTIGDHHFDVTVLQSASKYHYEGASMSATNIPKDSYLWNNMSSIDVTDASYSASMGTSLTESQMSSYMARINYSWKDRYLITVSGRFDGSSVLAPGHKWSFFPSAALGWRIDQEEFMQNVNWIDQLKLRVGVGTTGNAAVDPYSTTGSINSYYVPFGGSQNQLAYTTNEPYYTSSDYFVSLANPDLGWERTTQWNFGVDFSVLRGRIGGTIDAYFSRTRDLLMDMTIPTLTGYSVTTANVGETKNWGIEFTLNFIPIQTKNFEWQSSLNFAYQKDQIVSLANGKQDMVDNAWFIGQSISVFYGYAADGLWQEKDAAEMAKFNANGHAFEVGMVKPVDQNGDYKIDSDDRVILGNENPRWTFGWNNTFTWKGIELSIQMIGRMGYMVNAGGEGQLGIYNQRQISYWTPQNTNADYQKPIYNTSGGDAYSNLLGYKKASYLKVRNISLGYNLPYKVCKKMFIEGLKVYFQVKNPGTIFGSVDFMDLDAGTTYYNRGYTIGLDVSF